MDEKPKKPKGRPKSDDPSSVVLPPIRVTPDQLRRYREAATRAERSLSAWIRLVADKNS